MSGPVATVTLAVALVAGAIVGVVLGALGGGGAILAVPVLVFALGQEPKHATAGSLVIVGASALVAAVAHARAGRVRWGQGALFGLLGMAGSYAGSRLSIGVSGRTLLLTFAVLLLGVALLMWRRAKVKSASTAGGTGAAATNHGTGGLADLDIFTIRPTFHLNVPRAIRVIVAASAVGLLTGFFGVGGGFAAVPALVLALDFPMPLAVGTSLLVIAMNSTSALATRLQAGVVPDWRVVLPFTAAAILGSVAGSRWSTRYPPSVLARAFAVMLVAVSVYTALGALLGS